MKTNKTIFVHFKSGGMRFSLVDKKFLGNGHFKWIPKPLPDPNCMFPQSLLKPGDSLKKVDLSPRLAKNVLCAWTHEKMWNHQHKHVGVPQKLFDFFKGLVPCKNSVEPTKPPMPNLTNCPG